MVESFPSKIKPVETTTTTTTTTQPKVLVDNSSTVVPSVPEQSSYYPMSYTTYVDPNTGITYAYDPNWQYASSGAGPTYDPNWQYTSSGTGPTYDYSSYYTNPTYIQRY